MGSQAGIRKRWPAMIGLVVTVWSACEVPQPRNPGHLAPVDLTSISPEVVLPGSVLVIDGDSFIAEPLGVSWLAVRGRLDERPIDIFLRGRFVDFGELQIEVNRDLYDEFGANTGEFLGTAMAVVDYTLDGTRLESPPISMRFEFREALAPRLERVDSGIAIAVNHPIAVEGDGLLLRPSEGQTFAVVEGCFEPFENDATCAAEGCCSPPVKLPVTPDTLVSRGRGTFPFAPQIAGILPGAFEGTVYLRNEHADGTTLESKATQLHVDLLPSAIHRIGEGGGVGKYVDFEGEGFIGGSDGAMRLVVDGVLKLETGVEREVRDLVLVPDFVSGRSVRYVINEEADDPLAQLLRPFAPEGDVRLVRGSLEGSVRPVLSYAGTESEGPAKALFLAIQPVKQVIHLQFTPAYVDALYQFGLRSADALIREHILQVLRRDYESINIEFRTDEPTDYKLYSVVELSGRDPNQRDFLGYDNSPGKDQGNRRLHDRIGGFNVQSDQMGAGYGGVFVESFFQFSLRPRVGESGPLASEWFDQVFDAFRPDLGGEPVRLAELPDVPPGPAAAGRCPVDDADRDAAIECAIWVFGSLVGSTVSHEIGHSLGLSYPYDAGPPYHNLGDELNRLMDGGGQRPFEERAEILGQGPGVFCSDEYLYLRQILPSQEPETTIVRPRC